MCFNVERLFPALLMGSRGRFVSRKVLQRHGSILLLFLITANVAGCAIVYQDVDGTKHIIGLANVEIRPPADDRTIAGNVVDVTIVGAGIYSTEVHGGLVLGYSRDVTASIRDNVLVIGNPIQAIQARRQIE